MALFSSRTRNENIVAEDHVAAYGTDVAKNDATVRKLMFMVVKSIGDSPDKSMLELDGKEDELRKRHVKKFALAFLKQTEYAHEPNIITSVLTELEKYLWGYYVLDDLINDPDISDIRVLDWNYIRYKKLGRRYEYYNHFADRTDYIQFINLMAVRNKKSLSDVNAVTYFTDMSNSNFILRFNICTQLVCCNKIPVLTIRKIPKEKYTMEELIKKDMFDEKMAEFLKFQAQNASGIIFTGKGASGKTTLLNTMLEYIDENESAVVIQESDELFISSKVDEAGNCVPAKDIAFLHTISYNGEGKLEYSLPDLTRNGLRMDLDYFIIGEIKGDEAEGFSMASYTGHKCWATVHGMNSFEGINKLADYVKQATGYSFDDCLRKLIGIQYVIFMKEFKVCEITQISGFDSKQGDLIKNVIYKDGRWFI